MYSTEIELGQYLQIILGVNLLQHASHLSKTLKIRGLSRQFFVQISAQNLSQILNE